MSLISLKDVGLTRLWEKAAVDGNTWCWIWKGARDGNGYGEIRIEGKLVPEQPMKLRLVLSHLERC